MRSSALTFLNSVWVASKAVVCRFVFPHWSLTGLLSVGAAGSRASQLFHLYVHRSCKLIASGTSMRQHVKPGAGFKMLTSLSWTLLIRIQEATSYPRYLCLYNVLKSIGTHPPYPNFCKIPS